MRRHNWTSSTSSVTTSLLCICSLFASVQAQDRGQKPDTQEKLPSGIEVLDRFVEATGGREAYERIQSRVIRGRYEVMGIEGSMTSYQTAPDKFLMVLDLPGLGKMTAGTNGDIVWSNAQGMIHIAEGTERSQMLRQAALHAEILGHEMYESIECVGLESVGEQPCYEVWFTDASGEVVKKFFDKDSGLLVQTLEEGELGVGTTAFSDYREVDGVLVPHVQTASVLGMKQVTTYEEIEHNAEIPADRFAIPPEVRDLLSLDGPQPAQTEWLRQNAVPFDTVEAESGFEDLEPLKTLIGDARIVALGEATHGSREIFQMKHRLIEFLASEMGFTIFSIEANMPEAYRVNDYVLCGEGDPRELIRGMYFWTWSTMEVLDMVEWMRKFNELGQGRIEFTGFDMQYPAVAISLVIDFLTEVDPEYAQEIQGQYELISTWNDSSRRGQTHEGMDAGIAADISNDVMARLEQNRQQYLASKSVSEMDWALQNARVVSQCVQMTGKNVMARDQSMANNVSWILQHNPDAKIILWAHNGHVGNLQSMMGNHLEDSYGDDYIPIGFATYAGTYSAMSDGDLGVHDLEVPPEESIEAFFEATGQPRLILDLRLAEADAPESNWLTQPRPLRSIGAMAMESQFISHSTAGLFEILIYIQDTQAAIQIDSR